jgi:hypothetical protein
MANHESSFTLNSALGSLNANQTFITGPTTPTAPSVSLDQPTPSLRINEPPATPPSSFVSGNERIQNYNGLDYKIDLYLDNSGTFDMAKKSQYFINPQAIINMSIVDSINNWVVDGSITFLYTPEELVDDAAKAVGQTKKTNITGAAIENGKILSHYEFRGDGYDMLRVSLQPISKSEGNEGEAGIGAPLDIKENDPLWNLSYLFSVYETEDINDVPGLDGAASTYLKCIRLKFHDVRYQLLKTANIEYSTAQSPEAVTDLDLANGSLGVLPTGKALLEVFNKALADPDQFAKGNTSLEFQQQPSSEDWNVGEDSLLFYTSPAAFTAEDDVEYLFANHLGPIIPGTDVNDMCVMHTKRPSRVGDLEKICITPLTEIFKKATNKKATNGSEAGELHLEQFFLTEHTEEKIDASQHTYKSPDPVTNEKVLKTFKYGQIISYSFVDMSPDVNVNSFANTPVYSVDIGKRQFNIQFENNNVKSARKAIAEGYIKHLYKDKSESDSDENLFLPVLHNSKENWVVTPTYSLNGDNEKVRQKNGIHHLMYTGLFQNACICFKTLGLTLRESGTFIGIDKPVGSLNNDYANKVHGQYLVVKVDHIFEQGAYVNNIWAVKLHRATKRTANFQNIME